MYPNQLYFIFVAYVDHCRSCMCMHTGTASVNELLSPSTVTHALYRQSDKDREPFNESATE